MNIREEIAEVIATGRVRREDCTCEIWKRGRASTCPECTARKIVTLLKEHIEGLGVISDEEIVRCILGGDISEYMMEHVLKDLVGKNERAIAQAQLQYIKDEVGKEIKC